MAMASPTTSPTPPSVSRDWFREWFDSPYYHTLYFQHNEAEAAAFITRLLDVLQPPAASHLLDIACGRGRHARMLAEQGYDVTGIDLAPQSIAFAKQFENDHLHFYVHDMRRLLCTNCFHYAFNFFTSFGYFETHRENYNTIRMVASALRPTGIFVLDYLNARYVQAHLVPNEQKVIDGVTYAITRWCDGNHFFKKIVISEKGLSHPLEYTERVAVLAPADFEALFQPNGLHIRQLYGNYQLEPFDPDNSPRLILIAEKQPPSYS
jgi:SAM-dependent methyltransferase